MIGDILDARKQVLLESYIFAEDVLGHRFARALTTAVARGVHVRLHVDAVGCLFEASSRFFRQLSQQGVEVRHFHRWSWRDPWRYNSRNHCKLLIIDDKVTYIGGFNIHNASSARQSGARRWRDTHVRLTNPAITREAVAIFQALWEHRKRRLPRKHPVHDGLMLVSNRSQHERSRFRSVFREAMAQAQQHIRITTPYFAPDPLTRRHMIKAARRGVRVELLLPAVSDQRLLQVLARSMYRELLDAGIHIFEYRNRVLHAKTLTVDGRWGTVGTANLDYRSFFHNLELNLVSTRNTINQTLDAQFQRDLAQSDKIQSGNLSQPSLLWRVLGRIAWGLRRWL
nr:phospholipase D-like domain-containing protein [Natronospira proteinivora]